MKSASFLPHVILSVLFSNYRANTFVRDTGNRDSSDIHTRDGI